MGMRFLTQLYHQIVRKQSQPAPAAIHREESHGNVFSLEHRNQRRVRVGFQTQLYLKGQSPVAIKVLDASKAGVRFTSSEPIPEGSTAGVILHFNGYFLRMKLNVVWVEGKDGRYEIGAAASAAGESDQALTENFTKYLTWLEACRAA
jgi:hypothetical protein